MHATDENHPGAAVPTDVPHRHVLVDIAEMVVDTGQPSNGCERARSGRGHLSWVVKRRAFAGAQPVLWRFVPACRDGRFFWCPEGVRAHDMKGGTVANEYKQTMNLPKTGFPMRAGLSKSEPKRLKDWQDNKVYEQVLKKNEGHKKFVLHDGPPYANGPIHIGHAMNKISKDMINRYWMMQGYEVPYVPGWDCHGQPIEHKVEEKLGTEKFNQTPTAKIRELCNEFAVENIELQKAGFRRLGVLGDWDNPYLTLYHQHDAADIEVFKAMFDKGMIYRGHKPVHWCKHCHTALAEAEIEYSDETSPSIFVRFEMTSKPAGLENFDGPVDFIIWTTTPWTIPSDQAVSLKPGAAYVAVEHDGRAEVMLEDLAPKCCEEFGWEYTPVMVDGKPYVVPAETFHHIHYKQPIFDGVEGVALLADYVGVDDGTGIVHNSPGHGVDDYFACLKEGITDICMPVDDDGKFYTGEEFGTGGPFSGMDTDEANPHIIEFLRERGTLVLEKKITHSYPHCWRCDTPLIYYARESWFIKMTAVKDDLIRNNNTINWIPESIGKGRFGDWLENVQDWGISRNRYWGTPLNIWQCECGHMESVGSRQDLYEKSGDERAKTIELHRPYIDDITMKCPDCGKTMHRVPEVIDCWFDSGAMPFAQHHYPFENKDLFEQQFPADFISEAVDQTRGWFYSLLAESTLLFNKAPYKNVIVLGHVQDENGQKMSKSKGNAVDPFDALNKYGADAIRWYFYINSAPWLPNRFHGKAVVEGQRKFMSTLWNTYAFFVLYANIDNFDATKYTLDYDKLPVMDKWLLSKLNTMVKTVDEDLGSYKIPEAARALQEFVDDMSNWYVRRSRERFWAKGMEQDKINAYMTLYTALVTVAKAAAPMIPFMTEDIYQNLVRSIDADAPESIHLCDYPEVNEAWIDKDLEANMEELLEIVVLGRACRNTANIKNRQPIGTMYVKAEKAMDKFYTDIIADELNVKEVKFADDVESFISYSFKPQLRTVGPKYGKLLNGIRTALSEVDGTAAMKELRDNGVLVLDIAGNRVELAEEDLLIETAQSEGYVTETDGETSVVLDTNLTPELIQEGFVREIISKVQTMRKEAGFEVMDKIIVYAKDNDKIMDIMKANQDEIKREVLAENIILGEAEGYTKEWNINKEAVTLGVSKVQEEN